jgi:hypothetical protein
VTVESDPNRSAGTAACLSLLETLQLSKIRAAHHRSPRERPDDPASSVRRPEKRAARPLAGLRVVVMSGEISVRTGTARR